jgi:membrane-associated phospholipid phosphatase
MMLLLLAGIQNIIIITYINNNIDAAWRPILRDPTKPAGQQIGVTPQHPSYPSGHSIYGALAATILINEFGDNISFTDRTHEGETFFDGRPRSFTSFTKMAEENAYSRIPLGVHYRMDCVEGLRLGKIVAQRFNGVRWKTLQ